MDGRRSLAELASMLSLVPQTDRPDLVIVGGLAVELWAGSTGCRPFFKDLDLGINMPVNPFADDFLNAGYAHLFVDRLRDLAAHIDLRLQVDRRVNAETRVVEAIHPDGFTIDFFERDFLPVEQFTTFAEQRVIGGTTFNVSKPLTTVVQKLKEGRFHSVRDKASARGKPLQDILDVAFLLDRVPERAFSHQLPDLCRTELELPQFLLLTFETYAETLELLDELARTNPSLPTGSCRVTRWGRRTCLSRLISSVLADESRISNPLAPKYSTAQTASSPDSASL